MIIGRSYRKFVLEFYRKFSLGFIENLCEEKNFKHPAVFKIFSYI